MLALAILMALTCYTLSYRYLRPVVLQINSTVDFSCYYIGGKMVVSGDRTRVYEMEAQKEYGQKLREVIAPGKRFEHRPFNYPPFILLLFAPLSLLPFHQAEMVWYCLNVGMLFLLPFILRRVLGRDRLQALAMLMPAIFLPVGFALIEGQSSIVVLLLLTIVVAKVGAGRDMTAGCALALAMWKPQLAFPMLLVLVVAKRWKALVGFLAMSTALFGASVATIGWHATLSFPSAVAEFTRLPADLGGDYLADMANLRGMAYLLVHSRVSDTHLRALVILASVVLLLLAAMIFRSRNGQPYELRCAFVIVVTALASYHYYLHDVSLLILPFLLSLGYVRRRRLTARGIVLILTIGFFFIVPFLPGPYIVELFLATVVLGITLLAAIAAAPERQAKLVA